MFVPDLGFIKHGGIRMFKSLSCFCTVMVLASCISKEYIFAANSQSGKVGNNITWRLEGDTLYLEGTGSIPVSTKQAIGGKNVSFTPENYNQFYNYTWKDVADSVKTLIISEGITGIGKQSFFLSTSAGSAGAARRGGRPRTPEAAGRNPPEPSVAFSPGRPAGRGRSRRFCGLRASRCSRPKPRARRRIPVRS